jgi:hypothetical protein
MSDDKKDNKKVVYMSLKNEELVQMLEVYGIDAADYCDEKNGNLNRQMVCKVLSVVDLQVEAATGKLKQPAAVTEDGDVLEVTPESPKLHKNLSGMMVSLTFYNTDENDLPYVQMGLNGIALIVPREIQSWIPKEFIDGVLQNAIATKMKMDVDRRTGKIRYIPKQVQRVAYTVHDMKHIDVLRKEYDAERAK